MQNSEQINSQTDQETAPGRRDGREIVLTILILGATGSFLLGLFDINRREMLLLGLTFLVTLTLAYRGFINFSRWVAITAALFLISSLVFQNKGIRDTAVLGIVVVLISAGLLAGRRGTLIVGAAAFGEIALFGYLESKGIISNEFSSFNYFADYFSVCLSISLITIMQWLVITRLNRHIASAETELKERKIMEKQLRDAENRYRNLLEHIPATIYISEPGAKGRWHYVSPQITAQTGYTPEEWVKDPNLWFSRIHPDDRERTIKAEDYSLNSGQMPRLEYRMQKRNGEYIWIYDEGMLILDSDEAMIQGFMLDVTARKVAEEELKKRLAELDAVRGLSETLIAQTNLHDLICQTGEQIRITFKTEFLFIALLNTASNSIHFPYYYSEGKVWDEAPLTFGKGITFSVLKSKQPLLINENWLENSAKQGVIVYDNKPAKSSLTVPLMIGDKGIGAISIHDMEKEHAFTENDERLLSTIAANLAVAIENTRLQESLKHELTIQEKLVTELELKNAELERFTYTASHDLKSPLITIRGYLGYLERDARQGDFVKLDNDIHRISEAAEKMHNLLSDLLELSRVGRVMNESKECPFDEIVKESLKRVEGQLTARQVEVRVRGGLPSVFGDKERLIEVMQNLLDNACKFMGTQEHPTIDIGTQVHELQNIFYVRDNGIGIKKEYQEKVFGLFDKLDPNSSGTGVGLALVKRIIEVHGGNIWIESEEGKGTTFFFTLGEK
jgi:PAS domain S-box-containing protein